MTWEPMSLPVDERDPLMVISALRPARWQCDTCGEDIDGTVIRCPSCSYQEES